MGSSLLLRTGSSKQKSMTESRTQPAHGFAIGTVLRYNAATSTYIAAKADSAINAEVVGVVSEIGDADSFTLTYGGQVDIASLSTLTAPVLFLSGTTAGEATINPPSAIGTVIKPILAKNSADAGYVFINYLGTQIGGSSTVAIDQIQPVGSIIPYAGGVIPETWLACDGGSYAFGDYPELYTKLQYTTGSRVPMYGYVVEIQLSSGSAASWNATVVGDAFITNSTSAAPTTSSYEIVGKVISKTATTITGSYPLTVQVYPNYNTTFKNFIFPNKIPLAGSGAILTFSSAAGIEPVVAVATGTARSAGTINTLNVIAFNTPDLRSRFPIGSGRPARLGEQETDGDWFSSVGANYTLGSMGGQESNLTTLQAAAGAAVYVPSQATGAGSLPNIPPYVATQYIIKAKPYTRAAIIDGIDIPYDQLLVRNMKTRVLGGSNSSLELYTNTAGDGGFGTQRMTITTDGLVGIGRTNPIYTLEIANSTGNGIEFGLDVFGAGTGNMLQCFNRTSAAYTKLLTSALSYSLWTSGSEKLTITSAGNVGIGTAAPTVALDVVGGIKASTTLASTTLDVGGAALIGTDLGVQRSLTIASNEFYTTERTFTQIFSAFGSGASSVTVAGDSWLIGTFSDPNSFPTHFKFVHNSHTGSNLQSDSYEWGRHYATDAPANTSTFSNWVELPVSSSITYGVARQFRFDVRKKSNGVMELRMRALVANIGAGGHYFTFTTTGNTIYTPNGVGVQVVGTASTAPLGFHGKQSYEFPVSKGNYGFAGSTAGLFILNSGNVGVGTVAPAVALDVVGEARSSTSTTTASNAKTLVTKDFVDSSHAIYTYGQTNALSAIQRGNGIFSDECKFYVYPPSGKTMANLKGFIASIATIHFNGKVDGNDSMYCTYAVGASFITVWVMNSEQRSTPAAMWLAIWR